MTPPMTPREKVETTVKRTVDLPGEAKLAFTVAEAAKALGLSAATIWAMLKDGDLVARKLRGRTLIPRDELERVIGAAPPARAA